MSPLATSCLAFPIRTHCNCTLTGEPSQPYLRLCVGSQLQWEALIYKRRVDNIEVMRNTLQ